MEILTSPIEVREAGDSVRARGEAVGFVPTMGSLHEGHRSLIRRARRECSLVVVSIFVNPLQFGEDEDYARYPRDRGRDEALAVEAGVDVLWTPEVSDVYPVWPVPPEDTVDPGPIGSVFEGAARPGHFRGVLTVVKRLFGGVGPGRAYFGEKDAQQLFLVRDMVRKLLIPVDVVGCPIVREPDGLAMSSRNVYLGADERTAALCLSRALLAASQLHASGERDAGALRVAMWEEISRESAATPDYVTTVDDRDFSEPGHLADDIPARVLVSGRFGPTRLIDNMPLGV